MKVPPRIRSLRTRLLLLLAVVGPGIITANVDNDAGGITTYSVAGAHYGYSLLWMMPLVALALIIVQEMSARLGVVTGKGLADLIRETLGVRVTAVIIGIILVANLANTVSEFAGVAASMEIFGVSKYISVPAGGRRRVAADRQGQLQDRSSASSWWPARSTWPTSPRASWPTRPGRRWRRPS